MSLIQSCLCLTLLQHSISVDLSQCTPGEHTTVFEEFEEPKEQGWDAVTSMYSQLVRDHDTLTKLQLDILSIKIGAHRYLSH